MRSEEHTGWEQDFPVRYLLVREDIHGREEDVLWGRCAEVEGLFMDPPPLPRSVADHLCGGPSVVPPFTLVWHHAVIARHALAGHVLHHLGGLSYFEVTVNLLREKGVDVVLQ